MQQYVETQFHTIDLFIRSFFDTGLERYMYMALKKADTMAYIDAWKTELTTIQHIMDI